MAGPLDPTLPTFVSTSTLPTLRLKMLEYVLTDKNNHYFRSFGKLYCWRRIEEIGTTLIILGGYSILWRVTYTIFLGINWWNSIMRPRFIKWNLTIVLAFFAFRHLTSFQKKNNKCVKCTNINFELIWAFR